MVLLELVQALWFIWPAYCANAFPALMEGKRPLDFGKKLGGKRVLGSSKTIEGTAGGIAFGIIVGLI
ncbi:CDP-archaeol synthase, partial [Candidatus Woesearchaeota archaeon]|nr:CDP-archaeol synthase [Candidatus Woesearchaeota archaeon]